MATDVAVEAFGSASAEELEGLSQALSEFELNSSEIRVVATRAEPVMTIILLCVVTAFLGAIAHRAGGDTYDGLKRFVKRLSSRGGQSGVQEPALPEIQRVLVRSPTGLTVQIELDAPDHALRALADHEFTDEDEGTFHYVPERGEWALDPPV
jgi:hypothetical protein